MGWLRRCAGEMPRGAQGRHSGCQLACRPTKARFREVLGRETSAEKTGGRYIAATNVTLSPEAKSGGKTKVEQLFKSFQKSLGLKGWTVWAADELRSFLENAENVRTAYSAWLTPSDVLAYLLKKLGPSDPRRVLPLALARDLRAERDVRLRDAGQETETPLYLDRVFIDLPVSIGTQPKKQDIDEDAPLLRGLVASGAQEPEQSSDKEVAPRGVVAHLLLRCKRKYDTDSTRQTQTRPALINSMPLPNRVVGRGGPGQGKSTVGQFLAQVARARILQSHEIAVSADIRDLIQPILDRARQEKLLVEGPARFPIRIDLPAFADADFGRAVQELAWFLSLTHYPGRSG